MARTSTDRKRAERQEWEAAAQAVEIGLQAARAMRRAGKLSNRDLEVLERAAKHEHLNSRALPTEDYVALRKSGEYDRLAEESALSSDEVARAEMAVRRIATWFHSASVQQGHMTAKEAREALSPHVAIPDADGP